MVNELAEDKFQQVIYKSELGSEFRYHPLLEKDIWPLSELMYTPEELCNSSVRNIYFNQFQLHWVKLLCKYTFLVIAREKRNPDSCRKLIRVVQELDAFLQQKGYLSPLDLNSNILETFISLKSNPSVIQERRRFIAYAIKLWKEEEWLKVEYIGAKYKYPKPNIDIIPEETLV